MHLPWCSGLGFEHTRCSQLRCDPRDCDIEMDEEDTRAAFLRSVATSSFSFFSAPLRRSRISALLVHPLLSSNIYQHSLLKQLLEGLDSRVCRHCVHPKLIVAVGCCSGFVQLAPCMSHR